MDSEPLDLDKFMEEEGIFTSGKIMERRFDSLRSSTESDGDIFYKYHRRDPPPKFLQKLSSASDDGLWWCSQKVGKRGKHTVYYFIKVHASEMKQSKTYKRAKSSLLKSLEEDRANRFQKTDPPYIKGIPTKDYVEKFTHVYAVSLLLYGKKITKSLRSDLQRNSIDLDTMRRGDCLVIFYALHFMELDDQNLPTGLKLFPEVNLNPLKARLSVANTVIEDLHRE